MKFAPDQASDTARKLWPTNSFVATINAGILENTSRAALHRLILEVLAGAEHGVAGGARLRLGHVIPSVNPVQLMQATGMRPEACRRRVGIN